MKRLTDVVMVGGGVIGCSIAYALRKQSIDVIVLDRGEIGAQASSAATDLLAPLKPFARKDHLFMALLLSSFALFPVNVGIPWLMATSEAYRSLANNEKQKLAPIFATFLYKKQAVSPRSGHEPFRKRNFDNPVSGRLYLEGEHTIGSLHLGESLS